MREQEDDQETDEARARAQVHPGRPVLDRQDVQTLLGGMEITLAPGTLHQTGQV